MITKQRKLHITHIDNGVQPMSVEDRAGTVFEDNTSGRWPKVSFSDGETLSYLFLTNTKVVFLTGRNKDAFCFGPYEELILKFMKSDRPFNESNWRTQKRRVSEWKPAEYTQVKEVA